MKVHHLLLPTIGTLLTLAACNNTPAGSVQTSVDEALLDSASQLIALSRADEALPLLDSVINNESANDTLRAMATAEKGNTLLGLGRMQEALPVCHIAISEGERLKNDEILINQYSSCGIIYRRIGQPDSALWAYRKGVDIAKSVDAKDYVANLYNNIAVIYVETDRHDEGLGYANLAEKYAREANDSVEFYSSLATKSASMLRQKKYDMAAKLISREFKNILQLGSVPLILKTASPMLSAFIKNNKPDSALHYLHLVEPALTNVPPESNGAMGIMEIKAQLLHAQKRWNEELKLWQRLDTLSHKNKGIPQTRILQSMASCMQQLGRMNDAYNLLNDAYIMADSLKNSDVSRQMSEFSMRYKTQEKELQIERLRSEKAEEHMHLMTVVWLLCLIVVFLAVAVAIILYRRRLTKQKHELDVRRSYIDGLESERLRLAKELHDGVCNDLLGVQMLMASDNDNATCRDRLTSITQSVRQISHELMPPSFERCDTLTIISDYVENYPLAHCHISFECNAEDALQQMDRLRAFELYRIIQELLGNVARHAEANSLKVAIDNKAGRLLLTVENDGVKKECDESDGIGLRTTAERVGSLNGEIVCRSTEDGIYHVEVTL